VQKKIQSTMAFQIPLMRRDYDIYKMNNANAAKSRAIPAKQNLARNRKTSEPTSLSTSPGTHDAFINSPSHRNLHHVSSAGSRYQFSRVNSRTSQTSLMSPTRNQFVSNTSPPKPPSKVGSQNSLNKFHNRLVDKLRKAFKSGSSSSEETRSWKSHSVDLSPFRRTSTDNHKKTSASSAAILALERQFQMMEMDGTDSENHSDDDEEENENQCDEKFILIWSNFFFRIMDENCFRHRLEHLQGQQFGLPVGLSVSKLLSHHYLSNQIVKMHDTTIISVKNEKQLCKLIRVSFCINFKVN
jgi:hypothetical protein